MAQFAGSLTLDEVQSIDAAHEAAAHEVDLTCRAWGARFASAHEGLAVLEEEVHEFRTHVYIKQSKREQSSMCHELAQIAAVAIKLAAQIRRDMAKGEVTR